MEDIMKKLLILLSTVLLIQNTIEAYTCPQIKGYKHVSTKSYTEEELMSPPTVCGYVPLDADVKNCFYTQSEIWSKTVGLLIPSKSSKGCPAHINDVKSDFSNVDFRDYSREETHLVVSDKMLTCAYINDELTFDSSDQGICNKKLDK